MKFFEIIIIIFLISGFLHPSIGKEYMKKTIAIDLDGVLNNYTKFDENHIPPIKNGAKEFIETLSKNYDLVLFTNRSPKKATKWLIENNIDNYFIEVTNIKPIASIYVDDRAINFSGDYDNALEQIKNFKAYWKKIKLVFIFNIFRKFFSYYFAFLAIR